MNFALFETAIGCCGIVWSERGIAGVQLPERSEAATRNRLLRRFPMARDGRPLSRCGAPSTMLLRCSAASAEI